MVAEFAAQEVDMEGMEDGYFSDSEVVTQVQEALKAVARGDKEQYDQLNELIDPAFNKGPDQEAVLVSTLRALSGAVSCIDVVHHKSLCSSILRMSIWMYGTDVRDALMDLIVCLATSSGMFLDECLDMLVCNFVPPKGLQKYLSQTKWLARKKDILDQVIAALQDIANLVPLTPMRLWPIIVKRMPNLNDSATEQMIYVECMLRLESSAVGEFVSSQLLKALVDRLMDLDVDIRWEDILKEDGNKCIFDMELEDVQENRSDTEGTGNHPKDVGDSLEGIAAAEKLDGLMVLTFKHLQSCAEDGHLRKVFETLIESFQKTVLNAYKSKFVQFVMFYACSLDPENCGVRFAVLLTDIFLSRTDPPLSRMSAVAYLASYLSRAKFLGSSFVAEMLERLIDWCFGYCQLVDNYNKVLDPKGHRVFYSGCQAVMYVFCFRMRSMMNIPYLKSRLFHMPLEPILRHTLDPLKVCLPSIVDEFLRQAKAAHLFTTSKNFIFDNLLESKLSKSFGGTERLDMFFPFDPYLLKESDRFIRPIFEFWSTIKRTYGKDDSEEDEDDVLEDGHRNFNEANFADDVDGASDCHADLDSEDDLGYSMNKMSITPKDSLKSRLAGRRGFAASMPARIRPSTSPI